MENKIIIRGAQENNLKGVDLEIPHQNLIVVTGVSGSGKSSLAFDTICREGQRRYLESFSSYARQYLGKLGRPTVEHISGLSPALAIDQKTVVRNPRSTVGTLTELYDYLRLLYAKLGEAFCVECGHKLTSQTAEQITERLLTRYQSQDFILLAPVVDGHRGEYRRELSQLSRDGFKRVRIDGDLLDLEPMPVIDAAVVHEIEVVIEVFLTGTVIQANLLHAVEKTLRIGRDVIKVLAGDYLDRYCARLACPDCGASTEEIGPRLFSFNSTYGACANCKGLGVQDQVSPEALIADSSKTLREGALVPTTPSGYIVYSQVTLEVLNQVCQAHGFDIDIPWRDLTPEQQEIVLRGSDRIKIPFGKHPLESRMKWSGITAKPREEGYYKGILPTIEEILKRDRNKNILRFVRSVPCEECKGRRLRPEALKVLLGGINIAAVTALPISELDDWLGTLHFNKAESLIGLPLITEMQRRITLLRKLGLGYLCLNRESTTLSGGEAQRIRLATQVGTGLHGVLYVLDEPSIGLHHRDNRRLLEILSELRDHGNTVLVVEHDEDTMRSADWLIDIGPAAGVNGGEILYNGPVDQLLARTDLDSITRRNLISTSARPVAISRREGTGWLRVIGGAERNLKQINAPFKLGAFNVVTGVSGAGKSTLVEKILANALRRRLHRAQVEPGQHECVEGVEAIDKVIDIDQSPIGRTPRSNPATYTDAFDYIRALFAALPESIARGWDKGRFSMNVKGGRCEVCQGAGVQAIGMFFLGDVTVVCDECNGKRFHPETLSVTYNGKSILDVLEMPVDEACCFFADQPKIARILNAMNDVGLGYLSLGQSSTTLSGGEAQRVKLASELGRPSTGKTLYILDEPTTGLHGSDIDVLLGALNRLVEKGNSVIAIEHQLEFILEADWVLDLGPESGAGGGSLVAIGTPEEIAEVAGSQTGIAIREKLAGQSVVKPARQPLVWPRDIELFSVTTHNLKGIDVVIPGNRMTVITGVSGSGKSSLAFDTIYREGQRMFNESLSTYARRFAGNTGQAQVERMTGLTPTIAISQRIPSPNPRSTVGTMTEIYEYFRLLYARAGEAICPTCKGQLTRAYCDRCDWQGTEPLLARMFSFNHHSGACTACRGLGIQTVCDPRRLVTDPAKSLLDGAISGTKTGKFYGDRKGQHVAILTAVGEEYKIDFSKPWSDLDTESRRIAIEGTGEQLYNAVWKYKRDKREGEHCWQTTWAGFSGYINEEYERKHADHRGEAMRNVMQDIPCRECDGERLNKEMRSVYFASLTIADLTSKSVTETLELFLDLESCDQGENRYGLSANQLAITAEIRFEVIRRLKGLVDVGLDYLALDRAAGTLSGGEAQRIRLASQLGSGLCGVTYVLDEPTVGLHPRDTERLITMLRNLCRSGNTVVVVEHDAEVIRAADYVIDLGPGAGGCGGELMAAGSVASVTNHPDSVTGAYLRGERLVSAMPAVGEAKDRSKGLREGIRITDASTNNLAGIDLHIPAGGIVAVTGVSGSGKSTLISDVLLASASRGAPVGCRAIKGLDSFASLVWMDQSSIGATSTSNPATYTGIFDHIRDLFAKTDLARERGWRKTRFSFNSKGGRCETCGGAGREKISMDFLSDLFLSCESCQGKRFNKATLECTYRGLSIADVLAGTIDEAAELFVDSIPLRDAFRVLIETGLGYIQLGQAANTLSGGESQRLKLATELIRRIEKNRIKAKKKDSNKLAEAVEGDLYLFDEPTTGLHFEDTARLLLIFKRLVEAGQSIVVIEHNTDVIRAADWVIDLGPEGGNKGGHLVGSGRPCDLAREASSYTGQALVDLSGSQGKQEKPSC